VIIHIVQYRFPKYLDYLEIVNKHGIENIVFLTMEENDFAFFVEKTGINIPTVFVPPSFEELCVVINSCKLFVGALSMPLTIAHACQVPRIIGFSGGNDDLFNIGLC
jgi:ADP-heptose:LPS heptosyltransferase